MSNKNSVFIIAEIGVNHNGSLEMAKELIDICAEAGVNAVKFQTFKAEEMVASHAPKADYQLKSTDEKESQFEMIKKLELDHDMHFILKSYAVKKQLQFLSTSFDIESLGFLVETLNLPILKIASGEITNAPLLLRAAMSGKKIILSTGMSTLGEIEEALGVLAFGYKEGKANITVPSHEAFKKAYYSIEGQNLLQQHVSLLHCTTEYPTPFEEVNLHVLETLQQCFGLKVGYSDHTQGIAVALGAAALGATIIEKHITLDRSLPGPDHMASLEPQELTEMVKGIRQIELALGNRYKKPMPTEMKNQDIARKSIVAARNIQKGEIFTEENLTVKRPGSGLSPFKYWDLLGKLAVKSYLKDEVMK
ncbi:N-acetylneuraminate synthase [Anaerobacillus alkalilacustris]|uniref:N-acetylneuraminate synthase n=1 Tax=Anaerobacillus alkalilacustris TaxID=393763 RepID=A0A1S2LW35_9BACI|nr:N-acetylneuraminate synthase [Anaerobacillus alkalilacustris]OIJ16761.1 N-acetylneuraminate synthase [Anaerobacillus alkalilacustris]